MAKSIYYSDNPNERVQENDIVRIKYGANKNDLAIIIDVDRPNRKIIVMSIRNSSKLIFHVSKVSFCYHNTKAAARAWYQQMENNTRRFLDKYTDINYIRKNWFSDYFIKNNVTAETLMKAVDCEINKPLDWLMMWEQAIDLIIVYKDYGFVHMFCNRLEGRHYNQSTLIKLFNVLTNN